MTEPPTEAQKAEVLRRFRAGEPVIQIYMDMLLDEQDVEQVIREAVRDDIG